MTDRKDCSAESKNAKDFYDMSGPDLLDYCGADASKWAEAFCKIKEAQGWGVDDIDQGLMITWFANAIEHSSMVRRIPDDAQAVSEPVGYAPYHPKHGWRIDLSAYLERLAECYAMRNIESAAQQGWTIQPLYAAQPPAAPVETTPTKEEFAKWSRVWHDTCETMMTLLGLHAGGSPEEMLAEVQAHVGARSSAGSEREVLQEFVTAYGSTECGTAGLDAAYKRAKNILAAQPQAAPESYRETVRKIAADRERRLAQLCEVLGKIIETDQRESFVTIEADPAGNTMAVKMVDGPCAAMARAALSLPRPHGGRE